MATATGVWLRARHTGVSVTGVGSRRPRLPARHPLTMGQAVCTSLQAADPQHDLTATQSVLPRTEVTLQAPFPCRRAASRRWVRRASLREPPRGHSRRCLVDGTGPVHDNALVLGVSPGGTVWRSGFLSRRADLCVFAARPHPQTRTGGRWAGRALCLPGCPLYSPPGVGGEGKYRAGRKLPVLGRCSSSLCSRCWRAFISGPGFDTPPGWAVSADFHLLFRPRQT